MSNGEKIFLNPAFISLFNFIGVALLYSIPLFNIYQSVYKSSKFILNNYNYLLFQTTIYNSFKFTSQVTMAVGALLRHYQAN